MVNWTPASSGSLVWTMKVCVHVSWKVQKTTKAELHQAVAPIYLVSGVM